MGNKTDQSMSFLKQSDLGLPKVDRIVIQDLEERVVLAGSQRNFENLSHEIGENRTAAATLRLQMRDIRHGHIVGKVIGIVPIKVAIHHAGAESAGAVLLGVVIDLLRPLQEQLRFLVEVTVVIQVVDVEFKSAIPNVANVGVGHVVSFLRNNLKRGTNVVRSIDFDQFRG